MSNNKQSSVQQFWDKIALKLTIDQVNEFIPFFEQAEEMHKQEIKNAFRNGDSNGTFETINAEQYYKIIFGGKDE